MTYYHISNMDGETLIYALSRDELLEWIEDCPDNLASGLPDSDPNYWGDKAIVIKGEIVTPQGVRESR